MSPDSQNPTKATGDVASDSKPASAVSAPAASAEAQAAVVSGAGRPQPDPEQPLALRSVREQQ